MNTNTFNSTLFNGPLTPISGPPILFDVSGTTLIQAADTTIFGELLPRGYADIEPNTQRATLWT